MISPARADFLRVRSYGKNGDLILPWAIVPEDPVGRRRLTLCVGCKDLLTPRTLQAFIFVGVETGMVKVCLH